MPFLIRNLEDEDLVENFWLLMRAYGLEDTIAPSRTGRSGSPADLANRSSDWMYEVDPEWNRRLSGGELLENMIAGSGPAMTFAWPNTILPRVRNDPSIAGRIGLHQFARQVLLGAHVLAIPRDRVPSRADRGRAGDPDLDDQLADAIRPRLDPGQHPAGMASSISPNCGSGPSGRRTTRSWWRRSGVPTRDRDRSDGGNSHGDWPSSFAGAASAMSRG